MLELRLLGAPVADDGEFDRGRRVFDDRKSSLHGREHGDATRVAEQKRAAGVARVKEILDHDAVGRRRADQPLESAVNEVKAFRKRGARGRGQRATGHETMPGAVGFHASVTGPDGSGIDPEDPHANEASISFSSMSAFDQTFLVSSWSSAASISLTICCAVLPSSLT